MSGVDTLRNGSNNTLLNMVSAEQKYRCLECGNETKDDTNTMDGTRCLNCNGPIVHI